MKEFKDNKALNAVEIDTNFGVAYVQSIRNVIRQLWNRNVDFSADGGEWAEAYVSAAGRKSSVIAGETFALFDTNKYFGVKTEFFRNNKFINNLSNAFDNNSNTFAFQRFNIPSSGNINNNIGVTFNSSLIGQIYINCELTGSTPTSASIILDLNIGGTWVQEQVLATGSSNLFVDSSYNINKTCQGVRVRMSASYSASFLITTRWRIIKVYDPQIIVHSLPEGVFRNNAKAVAGVAFFADWDEDSNVQFKLRDELQNFETNWFETNKVNDLPVKETLSWVANNLSGVQINGIAFGGGRFVAVGDGGIAPHSNNGGVTFTGGNVGVNNNVFAIAYGNNRFVTVGEYGFSGNGNRYSNDGVSWQVGTNTGSILLNDVVFGGGRFVAVGSAGNYRSSNDGITWTTSGNVGTVNLTSVAFGNGFYVAVGNNGAVRRSSDGVSWQDLGTSGSSTFNSIAFGNGRFVAVGNGFARFSDNNGSSWSVVGLGSINLRKLIFAEGRFLGVGDSGAVMESIDGSSWDLLAFGGGINWNALSFARNSYVRGAISGVGAYAFRNLWDRCIVRLVAKNDGFPAIYGFGLIGGNK